MITTIQKSGIFKKGAILLALCVLTMSFNMKGDGEVVLNAGTFVGLETSVAIRSEYALPGQTLDFIVTNDVKVKGITVIPSGSIARGQIVRAQKAKGLGRPGYVEVQIKSVKAVDGQDIFLNATNLSQEGTDNQTAAIVLGVFVCILFLAIKGKEAMIPAGYQASAVVGYTTTISVE